MVWYRIRRQETMAVSTKLIDRQEMAPHNHQRLGVCRIMPFFLISALFQKINARDINYIAALNFQKCLDLRKNCYNPTDS